MRSKLIVLLFLLVGLCLLAACTEEQNNPSESLSSLGGVSSPAEPSAAPVVSVPAEEESSAVGEISGVFSEEEESSEIEESSEEAVSSEPEESSVTEESAEESKEEESSQPEESSLPEASSKPHKVNGFIVDGDRGMEPFGGSAVGGGYTAEVFNQFKTLVGDGVNVYGMPIPLACAFYAPEGYEGSISRTADCFGGVRDGLENVQYVDVLGALNQHTDEYIYAKTDHHWMALGAYYAAEALCKEAGVAFDTLDSFEAKSFDGFLGSIVTGYDVEELRKYPETFTWYEPTREYTAHYYTQSYDYKFEDSLFSSAKTYSKFIHGDSYVVRVETGVKNGRKLLVVKDSFGNALAPFLLAGFEEVYVVDYRKFNCNVLDFIEEQEITDVALVMAAFSVASSARNNIIRLTEI